MYNKTHHCNASTGTIFLGGASGQVQMYVDGLGQFQRVLRPLVSDAQVVRVFLDPAQRQFAALFDDLNDPNSTHGYAPNAETKLTSPKLPVNFNPP